MNIAMTCLLVLLLAGGERVWAQERSDSRKEQEKKEGKQQRTETPPDGAAVRRAVRPLQRESLLRSVQPGRDIPVPERIPDTGNRPQGTERGVEPEEVRRVFRFVEDGFAEGSIGRFSPYFASQVSLSLRGGETGSYSANQAYYVLENYLRTRRMVDFEIDAVTPFGPNPYATGNAGFAARSGKETAQVYIALTRAGARWVITQINIY